MRLFYSGAPDFFEEQPLASLSLGGRASNTFIPNLRTNNLFSDISLYEAQKQVSQTKGVFLKNTLPVQTRNVILFVEKDRTVTTEFFAAVVKVNNQQQPQMEEIPTAQDTPFFAEFHRIDVVRSETSFTLGGSLVIGQEVCIADVSLIVETLVPQELVQAIISAFEFHPLYNATLDPEDTSQLTFILKSKQLGELDQPQAIVRPGLGNEPITSSFALVFHERGLNNSQLILGELNPEEFLSIWFRRTPPQYFFDREATYEAFENNGFKTLPRSNEMATITLTWQLPPNPNT